MTRVAELFFPAIRWDGQHGFELERASIERALDAGVGGFILFGGAAEQVAVLTEELHAKSRCKLLIGADLERGAGQQFHGATALPPLAAIASLDSVDDIRRAGSATARDARSLGVNWVYAPDCDLDIEPDNPIVGTRSLGSDPRKVGELAAAWIAACQSQNVLACAKHFPGHGRTTTDSHAELPRVDASASELDSSDIVPFKAAIDAGVASVMSAHVQFPALDSSGAPATLSSPILRDLLRTRLRFTGLVITEALIMEGVLGGGEREAVVGAVDAGCDCLLYPKDLEGSIAAVNHAIESGRLESDRVRASLERRDRWAGWAAKTPARQMTSDDSAWASALAERVIHPIGSALPRLVAPLRIVVVDDDIGGPYPPPSREPFLESLIEHGVTIMTEDEKEQIEIGTTVIALYGDIRAWKGRPGYSAASRARVRQIAESARSQGVVIVQF